VANELSYLNEEPIGHISSLENPEEHPDPLLTRRAVWCAGVHPEIAPERSMDDVVNGIDRSTVLCSKWY